jgi:hypothetical protein
MTVGVTVTFSVGLASSLMATQLELSAHFYFKGGPQSLRGSPTIVHDMTVLIFESACEDLHSRR